MVDPEQESLKFLSNDFNQCFQERRHYDNQIVNILKFSFTGYTGIIGLVLGAYKYGLEKSIDFSIPAIAVLAVGFISGLLLFAITIRNRAYFVIVSRYINEQRHHFFKLKPLDFKNYTGMYTNYTQPPYFNWRSSQSWIFYTLALLNGTLFGLLLYFALYECLGMLVIMIPVLIVVLLQILSGMLYLRARDNKLAADAIFGGRPNQ